MPCRKLIGAGEIPGNPDIKPGQNQNINDQYNKDSYNATITLFIENRF
jgi:hypothetical protein